MKGQVKYHQLERVACKHSRPVFSSGSSSPTIQACTVTHAPVLTCEVKPWAFYELHGFCSSTGDAQLGKKGRDCLDNRVSRPPTIVPGKDPVIQIRVFISTLEGGDSSVA